MPELLFKPWLMAMLLVMLCVGDLMTTAAQAAEFHQPELRLPLLDKPPVVDGKVDDAEWAGGARMVGLVNIDRQIARLDAQSSAFYVACDGKELFIAMVSQTPPGGQLSARVAPAPDDADARTWLDDSIELVFDPLRTDTTGRRRLYHANINSRGAIHDTAYIPLGAAQAWRGKWRLASQVIGDQWHFEAAISLQSMGVTAADLGKPFGVRIARNWKNAGVTGGQSEWSAMGGAFLNPDTMPVITWDANAPVVQVHQLKPADGRGVNIRLSVRNPTKQAMRRQVMVRVAPRESAPASVEETLAIGPGQTRWVELSATPASSSERLHTTIKVASADGKEVDYFRDFAWQLAWAGALWTVDEKDSRKVDLNFAYYPSFDKAQVQVNFAAMGRSKDVRGVKARIIRTSDKAELSQVDVPIGRNFVAEKLWDIPSLEEGQYQCVVSFDGVDTQPMGVDFVRHHFAWEGNKLGRSELVPVGFEPLKVRGNAVHAVLREHELDSLGLWKQVTSRGQAMLQSPVRLEVVSGGKTFIANGNDLRITQAGDTRVDTQASWQAGPLSGQAVGKWEVDGALFWTLKLAPASQAIERVTLVIPLADRDAPLLHTCTDGIRFNYAGAMPAGQGVVWDGGKAPRNSIIGSYVPYIYIGGEERGLAVFGENDRGWVTSPELPCQQIVRQGDRLELRLNLVAASTVIDQQRELTIGFQATPTKPMPQGWRTWRTSYYYAAPQVSTYIGFMGSCWYWGSLTPASDIYPHNEDFSLWEAFAQTRRTGKSDPQFIQQWLRKYPWQEDGKKQATFKAHINGGFHLLAQQPDRVAVYTNGRGVRFDTREGQTFLDEWNRDLYSKRQWPLGGGVAYDLNPGESFRDYAMWHYNKMLDTFVDDIYWDDVFMQSNFNPVGSDTYVRPDGLTQPASGLRDMRELVRRTQMLGHEKGRPMLNWAHMTNTAIAPILSFTQIAFTWEDHAGDRDFQDRYGLDYLRAESLGRQHGNAPFALVLIKGSDEKKLEWVRRTFAGAMLTHEVKTHSALPDLKKGLQYLWQFGYGRADVRVHNYWDADYPLTVAGSQTASIVVAKPGDAVVVVCDWQEGGSIVLKPDASLGLGEGFTCVDVESGQTLPVQADGSIRFELRKHDFRMLRLTSASSARREGKTP